MQARQTRPVALIILDGWGESTAIKHNPIHATPTPTFDALYRDHPHISLQAAGNSVGLPDGQMGNSEVGHLHIGAGRKVPQDLTRINTAIETGNFLHNPTLLEVIKLAQKTKDAAVHIIGLLSPGGVHSMDTHLIAMIQALHAQGITKNYLHAVLDGRDTPPKSALQSLHNIMQLYAKLGSGQIASLIGRYYAMDRDQRWDRTKIAYDLLTQSIAEHTASNAITGLEYAYANNQTDEFVKPISLCAPSALRIKDGDVVIFMNFRADRARQLYYALTKTHFTHFERKLVPQLSAFVTLTQYASDLHARILFPALKLKHTLGEYVAQHGLTQLRIAETEKYAHVTYFMNGGRETAFTGEERILIPSPKVATYDLQPEMSAIPLTDALVTAIMSNKYDLIICNYANPDMIGHTGIETVAQQAVSIIDQCLHRVLAALTATHGEAIITADHGNVECMYDEQHHQPHTAHTTSLVPLIYYGRNAKFMQPQGGLDDIAPTILHLLGLPAPTEMTGHNLIQFDQ